MASVTQNSAVPPHFLSQVGSQAAAKPLPNHTQSKPRDVTAVFNYYKDPADGSPPAPTYIDKPSSYVREPLPQTLTVHDVRGSEDQYTLDTKGFQFVKYESVEKAFVDDEEIKRVYYPETEELLKRETGASKIFIFDHTIRRQAFDSRLNQAEAEKDTPATGPAIPVASVRRGPVQRVHIDQSYDAARERVTFHLPDQAEELLKGRFQIINVWRPISTILRDPLGVASAPSVDDDELVPIKLVYPNRTGETLSVRPAKEGRKGHEWHYLFRQTPEEVTLIKCFDSKTDGRARRVPHSAFIDEEFAGDRARESIEVRALVFHPDDTE